MKILLSLFISSFVYIGSLEANATRDGTDICGYCSSYSERDNSVAQVSQSDDDFEPVQDVSRRDAGAGVFRSDLMYKFLIAEFAKHNKLYDLAAETLVDILRSEERADIAEMAADAANAARRLDLAL